MAGFLTVDQIIYSSIGIMTVFLGAWVLLLQRDFQSRFNNAKRRLDKYREQKKEELRNNLSKKGKGEDRDLTEDLIEAMNILAVMKENMQKLFNDINGRSKNVIYAFGFVISYAIVVVVSDPEKQAILIGGTRLMELQYIFLIFALVFVSWFLLLLKVNQKMNELENKEVDELIDSFMDETGDGSND